MNPLLLRLIPFAVSAAVGFAIAWGIQGLRLTSAEQEFIDYKQEQVRILQEHNKHEAERQQKSAMAYAAARQEFADAIQAGEVFKRCVASGRCTGARNPSGVREPSANQADLRVPAPAKFDGASANPVSAPGVDAALNDCAVTTLQLNHLQQDIEAQPGYKE